MMLHRRLICDKERSLARRLLRITQSYQANTDHHGEAAKRRVRGNWRSPEIPTRLAEIPTAVVVRTPVRAFNFAIVIALATFACIAVLGRAQPASRPATQRSAPVSYRHIERTEPANHVHVIWIDLTDPRVRVRVCRDEDPDGPGPWQTQLRTVRETAEANNLYCAINAHYFAAKESRQLFGRDIPYFPGNPARVWGWAMSDGRLWSDDPGSRCALVIDRAGGATIDRFDALPAGAQQAVTGSELIVTDGRVTTKGNDRAPRTAVGLDRERTKLIFLVVDGRDTEHSAGMTSDELAREMIAQGCDRAIMLDGGGSSTMVLFDEIDQRVKVVNRPSDGHDLLVKLSLERPVACVLGVEILSR
jgi:hypothetical protein